MDSYSDERFSVRGPAVRSGGDPLHAFQHCHQFPFAFVCSFIDASTERFAAKDVAIGLECSDELNELRYVHDTKRQ